MANFVMRSDASGIDETQENTEFRGRRPAHEMLQVKALFSFILACLILSSFLQTAAVGQTTNGIEIRSVVVDRKEKAFRQEGTVNIGRFPQNIAIGFGPTTNSIRTPPRIKYQLEGFEYGWNEGEGEMCLSLRFYDELQRQVGQQCFKVKQQSADWKDSIQESALLHRREMIVVPEKATHAEIAMSSAESPGTVGIYAVANLVLWKSSSNGSALILIQDVLNRQTACNETNEVPTGWRRGGTSPSMAKVIDLGRDPKTKALAILDDSLTGDAEWKTAENTAPAVRPGDRLVLEWNEMYSIGNGSSRLAEYGALRTGTYRFHAVGLDVVGRPIGPEASLAILIPPPYWRTSGFWEGLIAVVFLITVAATRYLMWNKLQGELVEVRSQQALEHERLRIANDIHDDLGARVTQISMLSVMSRDNPQFAKDARTEFDQISQVSRELLEALYETVWAVEPANDNLDALENYICQIANGLCDRTRVRCRFHIVELPREIKLSSQIRHNISMAVKEAIHNSIKHANATEVAISVEFVEATLTVSVRDNGSGFTVDGDHIGNGLKNMRRRLHDIGGNCVIESTPGGGTKILLRVSLKAINNVSPNTWTV